MNSSITFRTHPPAAGTLRRPGSDAPSPAVVILPAVAGLNPYCAAVADALAEQGYASLAIDYYARRGGAPDLDSRAKAIAAVASLSDTEILADIEDGARYLASQPYVDESRLAVLGFCVGGTYALLAASSMDMFRCAITFYGPPKYNELNANKPLSPMDAIANLKCPLLGHYGEADTLIPKQHVEDLRTRLEAKPAEIYTYPGAGHAFHEDFRPEAYRPIAAQEAWQRSLRYLHWYCKN
ncbi:MAG TPA: dienelactone hydrolase family protein [Eoetvoesiella sp.]|uniref:dienelactone hydrolase family protein n=1 Tax=Eoetvoesiella sp. TaxID=1966355 RepID=UPI002C355AA2|nr:dienelactone hydrolase family protein [Eoetvoesiella sp.]HWK62671.1 dienelactone hydrolase family protein [Eoetvoesiella sp.]